MTRKEALALALALPETASHPHVDRIAVKVAKGRILATFGAAGDMNVKLTPHDQEMAAESAPEAVSAIPGGWGCMGWARVDLARTDRALVLSLLCAAWRNAAPRKLLAAQANAKPPHP